MKQIKLFITFCLLLVIVSCAAVQYKSPEPQKGVDLSSEEEEIRFGHYVDAQIQNDFIVLLPDENPETYKAIQGMGKSLVRVSDRPKLDYTFRILITDMVNAFAGPGGYVYVTTGLLKFAETRDEIAGVMAHEIGHVCARHSVKQFRNVKYALTLSAPFLILGSAMGGMSQLSALFFLSSYSRDYERQADYLGTKYIIRSGFNPQGLISFLQRLWEEKEKGRGGGGIEVFFRTHPNTLERIKDIKDYINELTTEEDENMR